MPPPTVPGMEACGTSGRTSETWHRWGGFSKVWVLVEGVPLKHGSNHMPSPTSINRRVQSPSPFAACHINLGDILPLVTARSSEAANNCQTMLGYIGVILGLHRDNGKENGSYCIIIGL